MRLLPSALLALSLGSTCFGWGGIGHQAVAIIAEDHLTPAAKAGIGHRNRGRTRRTARPSSTHTLACRRTGRRRSWAGSTWRRTLKLSTSRSRGGYNFEDE